VPCTRFCACPVWVRLWLRTRPFVFYALACESAVEVCVCVRHGCVCAFVARRGTAVPTRGRLIGRSRALAAGASWTSRTLSAPWAARAEHTTVIDAAGAIYVLGGYGSPGSDVWASTNGGTYRTSAFSGFPQVVRGYTAVLRGTKSTKSTPKGTGGVIEGFLRGILVL
jgi:hypothetical protein